MNSLPGMKDIALQWGSRAVCIYRNVDWATIDGAGPETLKIRRMRPVNKVLQLPEKNEVEVVYA